MALPISSPSTLISPRKRGLSIEIVFTPPGKKQRDIDKYQERIINIAGGQISKEPWESALQKGTITIKPLSSTDCKKGFSNSFILDSNDSLISPSVVKPAFFGSSDTFFWCPSERIASIVNRTLRMNLVPPTQLGMIPSEYIPTAIFPEGCFAVCSIQEFKAETKNMSDYPIDGKRQILQNPSKEIGKQLRNIAILDIILLNNDRGSQNLLVNKKGPPKTLTPIDHSMILDSQKSLKAYWLYADACKKNFSKKEKTFIQKLQYSTLEKAILKELPGTPDRTLKTLEASVQFLKTGAHFDLTPYELGSLMVKDSMQEFSYFEHCLEKAKSKKGNFSQNIKSTFTNDLRTISPEIKKARSSSSPITFPLPRDPRPSIVIDIVDSICLKKTEEN